MINERAASMNGGAFFADSDRAIGAFAEDRAKQPLFRRGRNIRRDIGDEPFVCRAVSHRESVRECTVRTEPFGSGDENCVYGCRRREVTNVEGHGRRSVSRFYGLSFSNTARRWLTGVTMRL